jgi:O-antigen ligase
MVSQWFGAGLGMMDSPEEYLEGSPIDSLILALLLVAALVVLAARGRRTIDVLRSNLPLVLFFSYCALSTIWSDYPFVAFKRWTKGLGNIAMIMVVLTDLDPIVAIKRLLARLTFLLVPLSVLFVKYCPELGRAYDRWTGVAYYNGVAVGKNSLGAVCLVCGLSSLWLVLECLREKNQKGRLLAHLTVLAMTMWLFALVNSATALACFLAGGSVLVFLAITRKRIAIIHVAVAVVATSAIAAFVFLDAYTSIVEAFGRDATLTGRTELWDEVLRLQPAPLLGAGFESFWLGSRAEYLWNKYWWHPNQAHNGYIEIYLNLGWIGLSLFVALILNGYRNAIGAVRRDAATGKLMLALLVAAAIYNGTEAAVKVIHPVWLFFLLSVAAVPHLRPREELSSVAATPSAPASDRRTDLHRWKGKNAAVSGHKFHRRTSPLG